MASQLTLYHYLVHDMPNYKYGLENTYTVGQHYDYLNLKHGKGGFFSICDKYFFNHLTKFAESSVDYERMFMKTHKLAQLLEDKFGK
jgi:hypothetical protein